MSKDDFEKGLKLLLNNAYNAPNPNEAFRSKLLEDLKGRQRMNAGVRKTKIITLYSSFSAVAAVVLFAFIPNIGIFTNSNSDSNISTTQQFASTNKILNNAIKTNNVTQLSSSKSPITTQLASFSNNTTTTNATSFIPTSAHAVNAVDVFNPDTTKWTTIEKGTSFVISDGTQVRTPLGATESVNFTIDNGPSIMLDGMSQIAIYDNTLALEDGRVVVSLNQENKPVTLQLENQDINLHPGSMVFATLDNDNSYTSTGIPAPMLVLLKGNATTENGHNTDLAQGRVYELFDTGTGRYPSRKVGSYENKRQFMPMIDAVQAAYKSNK